MDVVKAPGRLRASGGAVKEPWWLLVQLEGGRALDSITPSGAVLIVNRSTAWRDGSSVSKANNAKSGDSSGIRQGGSGRIKRHLGCSVTRVDRVSSMTLGCILGSATTALRHCLVLMPRVPTFDGRGRQRWVGKESQQSEHAALRSRLSSIWESGPPCR
ncbi:hypothetical protein E2562_037212 [Oryza meyeriana var. granulata]|uniref:Uncharacterized protein n=1 Tax=Oryza meyeriana var. granulata TaxID=110450 RepID=A0A6G1E6R2_9ORYZ|nr:hypothetical protein E2562_037212 [Oryza meyeriana var. granulata]